MAMKATKMVAAAGAMLLAAACSSDDAILGSGGGPGGGGGGISTVSALGITGEGGATEKLGLARLTDPLLGTEGVLGGGSDGVLGGVLPAELTNALAPVTDGLDPLVTGLTDNLPLGTVTDQIPALGISGKNGLGQDLLGQDLTGMLLGETGLVPGLLAGGNDGALGNIADGGLPGLPGLPGGGDGAGGLLAPVTDLLGDLGGGGLPGLPGAGGGDSPLAPVTDLLGGLAGGGLPGLPGAGGGDSPLAPVTGLVSGLTGALPVGK